MRTAVLAAFALLLGACPRPQYPECRTDPDCADHGQVCLNGFCKECRDDSNCKPDRPQCRNAVCMAKGGCTKSEDCAAGQRCAQGACVAECSAATAAQDCGQGKKCIEGRCAAEEECLADADCGDGRACVDKLCKAEGASLASGAAGTGCEAKPVYFGFDEATLSADARKTLDDDWQCLQREAGTLTVAGNTDERGTTEYNLALGERRAGAVKKYLLGLGAQVGRIRAISWGKERPADPGHDEAAWAKNRRVEFVGGQPR